MSLVLSELFSGLADLREFVPAVDATARFDELNSSASSAKKQICNIITTAIYQSIVAETGDTDNKTALRSALANATMEKQVVFDAIRNRKANVDVYKHEQEAQKRGYAENYYNAMDTLLELLESNEVWKETSFYTLKSGLQIKTAAEFNSLYPIDSSYLFYFRCIPIIEKILEESLSGYFQTAKDKSRDDLIKILRRALAELTVASAIEQFDPMELPLSLRNLTSDSTAQRSVDADQSRLMTLSGKLKMQALESIKTVDTILNSTDDISLDTGESFDCPTDQILLLS
jgi:hypothetical protein